MEKEAESRRKREVEITVLEKVGQVTASIKDAKHVDQVICAVHSFALLLFPLDSHSLAGSVNEQYKKQLTSLRLPATHERDEWWQIFYKDPAFSTLARVLLYDVAFDWLACIPISARMHVYDVFFLRGQVIEVVQKLVPCLQWRSSSDHGTRAVHSNAERLLVLCLLDNKGVTQIAREFNTYSRDLAQEELKQIISRVVQLLTLRLYPIKHKREFLMHYHHIVGRMYEELGEKGGDMKLFRLAKVRERKARDLDPVRCIKDEDGRVLKCKTKILKCKIVYMKPFAETGYDLPPTPFRDGSSNFSST